MSICVMYCISGASGEYTCINCLINTLDRQRPKWDKMTSTPPHTLDQVCNKVQLEFEACLGL